MIFSRSFIVLLALCALCWSSLVEAKVRVVTTNTDLAAIVDAIGGDHVAVTPLGRANQNPHDIDARPSFLVPLSRADLLILTGLELEAGWLPPLLENARNAKIQRGGSGYLDASQFVHIRGVPPAGTDRASGDVHPLGNPHYLYDPRAAKRVAIGIRDALIRIDGTQGEYWAGRTDAFLKKLDALAVSEHTRFSKLPADRRVVVSYHDSTVYLFDWLNLTQAETLEPNPGISPTPRHTANVLQIIRDKNIAAILQEPYYPRKTAETLAKLAQIHHVIFPSATDYPRQDYLTHLREVADAIYRAISP